MMHYQKSAIENTAIFSKEEIDKGVNAFFNSDGELIGLKISSDRLPQFYCIKGVWIFSKNVKVVPHKILQNIYDDHLPEPFNPLK